MKNVTVVSFILGSFSAAGFFGCSDHGRQHGKPSTDMAPACVGLQCNVEGCPTSVSGTVYAPNGTLPLYNVTLYVPNAPLDPLTKGASCDRCGTTLSGSPITTALSDYKGHFQLNNVPSGSNIPLVIQLGKWRRQVTIPNVTACTDNPLTDPNMTRLPKKQSEGDMPRIAVTLGSCDHLSCMLPKVGIDSSEFGVASDGDKKAVHFYSTPDALGLGGTDTPGPPGMSSATPLWSSATALAHYDAAIFSCECSEAPNSKDATSYAAVRSYLDMGGRIFTTDFQYTWYKFSPDPQMSSMGVIPGGAPPGNAPITVNTSFPKGKALADWMDYTKLSPSYGQVVPDEVYDNFSSVDPMKTKTFASAETPATPHFITVNTPVGQPAMQQCGRAIHLDAHINLTDTIDASFPAGCSSSIKSSEAAFAFLFFDLSSCIQDESMPPMPPPIQ